MSNSSPAGVSPRQAVAGPMTLARRILRAYRCSRRPTSTRRASRRTGEHATPEVLQVTTGGVMRTALPSVLGVPRATPCVKDRVLVVVERDYIVGLFRLCGAPDGNADGNAGVQG